MIYYLSAFLVGLSLCSLTNMKSLDDNVKKTILFLSFIPLFLISILRYNTGTDYLVYSTKQIPQVLYGNSNSVEFLYESIIKIGYFLNNDSYFWIFALTHLLIFIFCYLSIIRANINYTWAYFLFFASTFFNISLNLMRQSIAISIFYFCIPFIYEKRWKPYFIFILLAMSFHTSIVICLPLYFLNRISLKWFNIRNISMVCVIFFVSAMPIRALINLVIQRIPRYAAYNGNRYDNLATGIGSYFNIFTIVSLIILFCIVLNLKYIKLSVDSRVKSSVFLSLVVITVITSFYQPIIPNANRIIYIFLFSTIVTLPYFIKLIPGIRKLILNSIFIILFIFLFYNSIIINNAGETLPYQTIFMN